MTRRVPPTQGMLPIPMDADRFDPAAPGTLTTFDGTSVTTEQATIFDSLDDREPQIVPQIAAQDAVDRLTLPAAPADADFITAAELRPGDRLTAGRGSRYKGPDLYVRTIEPNPVLPHTFDITGTGRGERLTAVPATFRYYVHRNV